MAKKMDVKKIIKRNQLVNEKLFREAQALSKALPKGTKMGTGYRLVNPFKRMVTCYMPDKEKEAA